MIAGKPKSNLAIDPYGLKLAKPPSSDEEGGFYAINALFGCASCLLIKKCLLLNASWLMIELFFVENN